MGRCSPRSLITFGGARWTHTCLLMAAPWTLYRSTCLISLLLMALSGMSFGSCPDDPESDLCDTEASGSSRAASGSLLLAFWLAIAVGGGMPSNLFGYRS